MRARDAKTCEVVCRAAVGSVISVGYVVYCRIRLCDSEAYGSAFACDDIGIADNDCLNEVSARTRGNGLRVGSVFFGGILEYYRAVDIRCNGRLGSLFTVGRIACRKSRKSNGCGIYLVGKSSRRALAVCPNVVGARESESNGNRLNGLASLVRNGVLVGIGKSRGERSRSVVGELVLAKRWNGYFLRCYSEGYFLSEYCVKSIC